MANRAPRWPAVLSSIARTTRWIPHDECSSHRPVIGVFDSGFGGLDCSARAAAPPAWCRLPLPGRYRAPALRIEVAGRGDAIHGGCHPHAGPARMRNLIVIACNTASALALPSLEADCDRAAGGRDRPRSASAAAAIAAPGSTALVLATEATVASHAYAAACTAAGLSARRRRPARCLFRWSKRAGSDGSITERSRLGFTCVRRLALSEDANLQPLCWAARTIRCCGRCFRRVVKALAGEVPIVDSAEATAKACGVPAAARCAGGLRTASRKTSFFATDAVAKFQRLRTAVFCRARSGRSLSLILRFNVQRSRSGTDRGPEKRS